MDSGICGAPGTIPRRMLRDDCTLNVAGLKDVLRRVMDGASSGYG